MRALATLVLFSATLAAQSKPACDRGCLESYVDKYLDAVIAHDPAKAPIAKGAKFTENGQRLDLGDGLWNTMDGKGTYRLFVDDVEAQQVAFLGSILEDKVPAMLALRLRIGGGKITEIETFIQRSPSSATGFERIGYKWTDIVPPAERMSREDLVATANQYFTGMQKDDGKGIYPFTDDCNRIENGGNTTNVPVAPGRGRPDPKTATNYSANWGCKEQFQSGLLHFVTRIRDRRFVAVDPERGLVFAFGFFDHSGGNTRHFMLPDGRQVTAGPDQLWTWEIAEVFQLRHDLIHQIEATMERVPYGMNAGWSSWMDGLSDRGRDAAKQ